MTKQDIKFILGLVVIFAVFGLAGTSDISYLI